MKFLHIGTAFMLLAGIAGRQLTRAQAARTEDIGVLNALITLSGRFENLLVIPGSLLVFVFGIIVALMRGWPVLGFLQGSSSNWLLVSLILYLLSYPLVIFIFVPRGKVFVRLLADALARREVTAELRASFHDRTVRIAHPIEEILALVILFLMVMKPF